MGHKCDYHVQLVKDNGDIVMNIIATWKSYSVKVVEAKLFQDEIKWYRGLQFNIYGGYIVSFPHEKMSLGYYAQEKVSDFENQYIDGHFINMPNIDYKEIDEFQINWLKANVPQDKYIIDKVVKSYSCRMTTLFSILKQYHKLSDNDKSLCEYLFEKNLPRIAMNQNLYKLSKKKRTELFQFIQILEEVPDNLQAIQWMMKHNTKNYNSYYDLKKYAHLGLTFDQVEYLQKLKKDFPCDYGITSTYLDYLRMVKEEPTANIKDKYWYAPKEFSKMNERLKKLIAGRKQLELNKLSEEMKKRLYQSNIKEKQYEDYVIYASTDMNEWKKQAEALHQCIITCKYYNKVIEGKSLVFFISKNSEPFGTFEIDYKKKILQAYGNEEDRAHCSLPPQVMEYVKNYIKELKLKGATIWKLVKNMY